MTNLLEVSIGRSLGAVKGLTPFQLETLFFTNLLQVSIGRDLGALKRLTPSQLETLLGDKLA